MIKQYLMERLSWIILFLSLQLLLCFVAYLDPTIPVASILYIIFLSLLIFSIFLVIRYHRETTFYTRLLDQDNDLDLTQIADPRTPFEQIVSDSIIGQTEQLKQLSSHNLLTLEQERDDMLAWIHEVKTPLTTMHLMIDRIEDKTIKRHLSFEWLRIHLLLDQQLHQKRIPFIENDLYMEVTNIESLFYAEIKTLQSWCIQKGIGFDFQLEKTKVLSDGKWLAFILRQLLTNSIKYSNGSDILVKSFQQEDHIILEVKDFGRGIAQKDIPRIFDKGFTSTVDHYDNAASGMGLYLTKKIAQSLLIKIEVYSEFERGTTFTLTFPKINEFLDTTGM
ncbi:histidine kinase [Salipaludibacillus neizhouensis]|uniref:histidine kinase n=1 Tax=Salipaludibacillus neizhouensis TaxID=885475 RepID=A0A3A9K408_9BACI|nr:sensor histidine kinase [Salipaludibacillus neizhouensis]RKL66058.1 histidine kinase [Salipaludibacillus neizhouensis]